MKNPRIGPQALTRGVLLRYPFQRQVAHTNDVLAAATVRKVNGISTLD